jgi:hypothetical protein
MSGWGQQPDPNVNAFVDAFNGFSQGDGGNRQAGMQMAANGLRNPSQPLVMSDAGPGGGLTADQVRAMQLGYGPRTAEAATKAVNADDLAEMFFGAWDRGSGPASLPQNTPSSPSFLQNVGRFVNAGVNTLGEMPLVAVDTTLATLGLGYTWATGRPVDMPQFSFTAAAAREGATTTEMLHGVNPMYGLMVAGFETSQAIERGDTGKLFELGGMVAGGVAGFKAVPALPGYEAGLLSASTRAIAANVGRTVEGVSGDGAATSAALSAVDAAAEFRANFVGPTFGKSGFISTREFADASYLRYQSYVDDAYAVAVVAESKGLLKGNPNTRLGAAVDRDSATRYTNWLASENIPEGVGGMVQANRWLRDPSGTGLYVRPDIRIPGAGVSLDATVGLKWSTDLQITRFSSFSGGDRITIVRPQQLGGGQVGGSYSIWP